jgi:hypothetical protein
LGEQCLKVVVRDYRGTKAASEAERVLSLELQKEEREAQRKKRAANTLNRAKTLLTKNPEAGKRWLRKLVTEFAGTKAADEAQLLLGQAE